MGRDTVMSYSRHSLYDLNAGRLRRRARPGRIPESYEGIRPAVSPEDYILGRHNSLKFYPYIEHPDLPDPALVLAVHYYVSQKLKENGHLEMLEAYDETALIAIAIDIEEKIKALNGTNGHLAYAQKKSLE